MHEQTQALKAQLAAAQIMANKKREHAASQISSTGPVSKKPKLAL
jgi:hypothetical protein